MQNRAGSKQMNIKKYDIWTQDQLFPAEKKTLPNQESVRSRPESIKTDTPNASKAHTSAGQLHDF